MSASSARAHSPGVTAGSWPRNTVPTGGCVPEVLRRLDKEMAQEQDMINFVNRHKAALFNELLRCERLAALYFGVGAERGCVDAQFTMAGGSCEAYTEPLSRFILLDEEEEVEIQPAAAGHKIDESSPRRFETMPGELPYGTVTLMILNVPLRYRRQRLLKVWPPENCYNFIHVPVNSGRCVVNFLTAEIAAAFHARWHRKRLPKHGHSKPLKMCAALTQGLEANLLHAKATWGDISGFGQP